MKNKKMIDVLLIMGKEIRKCYQEIVNLECFFPDKTNEKNKLFTTISEYKEIENDLFKNLTKKMKRENNWDTVYQSLISIYPFPNENALQDYCKNQDQAIEVRRLLEKIESKYDVTSEEISQEEEEEAIFFFTTNPRNDEETLCQEIMIPLMKEEDIIRTILKIDSILNVIEDSETKKKLCQWKYDLIYLNEDLENILLSEYVIPSLSIVDSKRKAKILFDLDDELVENTYDMIHSSLLFEILTDLTKEKYQNLPDFSYQLHLLLSDVYASTIPDQALYQVISDLENMAENSYNQTIGLNRSKIFEVFYQRYQERFAQFEIEEFSEQEINEIEKETKEKTKKKPKEKAHKEI